MPLTLTAANQVLKEFYEGDIREQLNNDVFWLAQIESNNRDFEGRRAVFPVHVKRNSGVGARAENGTLPSAGNQGWAEVKVPIRYMYGRIQLSGPVIQHMGSDRGSFIRAMTAEQQGLVNDVRRDLARQVWGTSNGVIATCGTTSSSTTVQLASATSATQLRHLEVDMVVDIGTVASPTSVASARTITAIDTTNKTITISGAAVSTTGSNFVFRTGSGGASDNSGMFGDGQVELTGLQTIVSDTGTLFTVNPTSQPRWRAQRYANSGTLRNVSETMIEKAMQDTYIASGQTVDLLVTSAGVGRAVSLLLKSLRRNTEQVTLKGGYTGLSFGAPGMGRRNVGPVALAWDMDCPENQLFGLTTSTFKRYVLSDWSWMQSDGAVLSRVANTDAYEATMFAYLEQICDQRNANFVIADLATAD